MNKEKKYEKIYPKIWIYCGSCGREKDFTLDCINSLHFLLITKEGFKRYKKELEADGPIRFESKYWDCVSNRTRNVFDATDMRVGELEMYL